ncbi:MAG TPA: phosphoglycerate kinase [Candidatus Limnocylindria bacterium]|nr:phosphoglycerate kinase [Candidatus Limnocylindria bacterium]
MVAFRKRTIRDADPSGKKVFVRVDFNVPLESGGAEAAGLAVADDTRIRAAIPTIASLTERGGAVALCSHLGRPKGRDPRLSLAPVAKRLGELRGKQVPLLADCAGPDVRAVVVKLRGGDVVMFENVRFHPEEEANDAAFARELAAGFDLYVNDAFGAAHRAHASTEGIAHVLPGYVGLLMEKELTALGGILTEPKRPFLAIIGGAKVSSKIDVLRSLVSKVDTLAVGGGMANTFLLATGHRVGTSLVEDDRAGEAARIIEEIEGNRKRILLPVDVLCAPSLDAEGASRAATFDVDDVPEGMAIVDIGPRTVAHYRDAIREARTVFWNGPVGVFEVDAFGTGTRAIAQFMADNPLATTVVGGGESVQAVTEAGLAGRMTHVSTGGGASLEFMEGKMLPGVAAIPDAAAVEGAQPPR